MSVTRLAYQIGVASSEHPERKEGVFVQLSSKEGDLLLTSCFDRDKDGKPVRPSEK